MNILYGYLATLAYLISVFAFALFLKKTTSDAEISRKCVHIAAGLGWIIYRIFFPASIHTIILSLCFVFLTIYTTAKKIDLIERNDNSLGTIYFTISMALMSILSYFVPALFDSFGIAIVCLSCGDGFAGIIGQRFGTKKIYKGKSVQGLIACIAVSSITTMLLSYYFAISITPLQSVLLGVICGTVELVSGDYDNLTIPFVLLITSFIFQTDGFTVHLGLSIGIGIIISYLCWKLDAFTLNGSLLLFVLVIYVYYFGGSPAFGTLICLFSVIVVVDKALGSKTEHIVASINKEHGKRNAIQLAVNAIPAIIALMLYNVTDQIPFIIAYIAAVGETIGDSIASDVGVLSKSDPVDICTFKQIQRGLSGGISLLGTLTSILACIFASVLYLLFYNGEIGCAVIIAVASFTGVLLDSVLGSTVQAKYKCVSCSKYTEKRIHCQVETKLVHGCSKIDNVCVNSICNAFSCIVAGIVSMI